MSLWIYNQWQAFKFKNRRGRRKAKIKPALASLSTERLRSKVLGWGKRPRAQALGLPDRRRARENLMEPAPTARAARMINDSWTAHEFSQQSACSASLPVT